jgi:hypothetical protein
MGENSIRMEGFVSTAVRAGVQLAVLQRLKRMSEHPSTIFATSNPLTTNISFYTNPGNNTQRWLVIFSNVDFIGQISCDAVQGNAIWFVGCVGQPNDYGISEYDFAYVRCYRAQDLAQVEARRDSAR